MVNYARAKVYKIINPDNSDECYVGSTVQSLIDRFSGHKYDYIRWKSNISTKYMSSFKLFEKYGVENCQIVLLEACEVTCKIELLQREQHYIKTIQCVNQINAHTTTDQRKEAKKHTERPKNPKRSAHLTQLRELSVFKYLRIRSVIYQRRPNRRPR
jgi:ribosome-interacting GTPase 1